MYLSHFSMSRLIRPPQRSFLRSFIPNRYSLMLTEIYILTFTSIDTVEASKTYTRHANTSAISNTTNWHRFTSIRSPVQYYCRKSAGFSSNVKQRHQLLRPFTKLFDLQLELQHSIDRLEESCCVDLKMLSQKLTRITLKMSDFHEYERRKEQKSKAEGGNSSKSPPFTTPGQAERSRHSKTTPARSSTPDYSQSRY